ncbi:hypothetical protein [Nocardia carnea]|uniref:hypothetical protein n=1 Tax=Nocardia carnea TaxID=37328 RepID=UPI002457DE9F|nr:hypothetical protein [Nocardia carnea]
MRDVITLIHQYGSPLYIYELDAVAEAHADLRSALPSKSVLYYSLKANPHVSVARKLREAGCRAELSSPGELRVALKAGFRAKDCLYTGPGKTRAEIDFALRHGVRCFSAESAEQMTRIGRLALQRATEATILLRVNGGAEVATGLRMNAADAQFGIDERQVLANPDLFRNVPGARLIGLHLFPLSNARDEAGLVAAFQGSIALAARLRAHLPVQLIDLGGGFATPYAQPGARPVYSGLLNALTSALDRELPDWRLGEIELAFESGRYLVGDCGQLVTTVQEVRIKDGRTFVVVDAGINHLGGMTGLGRLARPAVTPNHDDGAATTLSLVGPLCTPADVLGRDIQMPIPAIEDRLVVPNVGAYGLSASLVAFLGRVPPAEIVMSRNEVQEVTRLQLTYKSIPIFQTSAEAI